jgi:hypothetical protein
MDGVALYIVKPAKNNKSFNLDIDIFLNELSS